jgi:ABC-type Mn2+/Zn2+ transport system ATPase subunit
VDIKSQQEFYSFLRQIHRERGVSIILVSHDVGIISRYVTSVLLLNKSVCCTGSPHELPKLLSEVYGKEVHIHHHHEHHHQGLGGHSHESGTRHAGTDDANQSPSRAGAARAGGRRGR